MKVGPTNCAKDYIEINIPVVGIAAVVMKRNQAKAVVFAGIAAASWAAEGSPSLTTGLTRMCA